MGAFMRPIFLLNRSYAILCIDFAKTIDYPEPMSDEQLIGFRALAENFQPQSGGYQITIEQGWRQGRTAYGGLTAGLSLAAIAKDFPDLPPLKTIQTTFVGPVAETPILRTQLLRQGRNVTTIEAKVYSGDEVSAVSICMFGSARESHLKQSLAAKSLPDPNICEPFMPKAAEDFVPEFAKRFETKMIEGGRPMSQHERAFMRVWSRHKDVTSRTGADGLMVLGDVLPPAATTTFKQMGPISSMNWHMNILVDDVDSEDGWYQLEIEQTAALGGYSSQPMRYWNKNGDLIAEGLQSVAIFV